MTPNFMVYVFGEAKPHSSRRGGDRVRHSQAKPPAPPKQVLFALVGQTVRLPRPSFSAPAPRDPVLHHRQRRVGFVLRRNKRQKPPAVGGNVVAIIDNNLSEQG